MPGALALLIFAASGALALGYQVLWGRFLIDFLGASAYSHATVLAAFMGGLALGSAALGKAADRAANPLRLYAGLEAGIGLYALAYPRLADAVALLYARWASLAPEQAGAGHGLWAKAAASGLLLLAPTFLMGGTYPAMLRHATERLALLGRKASQLYAANAAGAVLGALSMAFLLMPALGTRRSLLVLGLANGLLALGALVLARWSPEAPGPATPAPLAVGSAGADQGGAMPETLEPPLTLLAVRLALLLILVEGFSAFALEIAWTRYLSVILGSSTYSFAIMLAAFTGGIAAGSVWLGRLERRIARPLRAFGWTQMLAGLFVLLPLPLYPWGSWLLANYRALFSNQDLAFLPYEAGTLILASLLMLPATVPIGMALPLVVKGVSRSLARLGGDAGRVYAWNTWGDVAGALLAGLLLLPALGMERLLRAAALGSVFTGLAAVALESPRGSAGRTRVLACAGVLTAAALASAALAGPWRTEWFVLAPFRRYAETHSLQGTKAKLATYSLLLFADDPAAHVMVYTSAGGSPKLRTLAINGKPDASSGGDMPTQLLLAHVPLLLAPQPRDVLVVGLASGVTSGAVLVHPVRRLDVVEIVSAMPKATRLFRDWNGDPMADPRFHLIVDDARSYLSYTPRRYDVIVSEPSNPWMSGAGALFARGFYERAAAALTPDGVFMQWVQAYEISDETFAAAVRTFRVVFPYVYAFQANATDVLLLGSRRPLSPDWPAVRARFAAPRVHDSLGTMGVQDLASLLSFQRLSPPTVDHVAALTDLENTDDNHLLENRGPRDLFRGTGVSFLTRLDERFHSGPALLWSQYLRRHPEDVRPLPTMRALAEPRVRLDEVVGMHQLAAYQMDPGVLSGADATLFPLSYQYDPPDSPEALVERLARFVAQGRGALLLDMLRPYAPAILLESALSRDKALFWRRASAGWLSPPVEAQPPELRSFHVELLMASGGTEDAARELLGWVGETPPPDAAWATLRACEIDSQELCSRVLERYAESSPESFVDRLRGLRPTEPRGPSTPRPPPP